MSNRLSKRLLSGRIMLLALLAMAVLTNSAVAKSGPEPPPFRPDGPPPQVEMTQQNEQLLLKLLSLTDEQQQSVQQLFAEKRQILEQNRKQLGSIHEQLRPQMEAAVLDEALISSLLQQEAEIKAKEMIFLHQQDKQLAIILTEEQQKKAEALREIVLNQGGPGLWF